MIESIVDMSLEVQSNREEKLILDWLWLVEGLKTDKIKVDTRLLNDMMENYTYQVLVLKL